MQKGEIIDLVKTNRKYLFPTELPPTAVPLRIEENATAAATTIYCRAFGREAWEYHLKLPHSEKEEATTIFHGFWESPRIFSMLKEGQISYTPTNEDGSQDLFISVKNFLPFLEDWKKEIDKPSKTLKKQKNYESMKKMSIRVPEIIKKIKETNTNGFVRLRNSYPISVTAKLFSPERFSDPNYYLILKDPLEGKYVRVTSETKFPELPTESFFRAEMLDEDSPKKVGERLGEEVLNEGIPITVEQIGMLVDIFSTENVIKALLLADLAVLNEGLRNGINRYRALGAEISKRNRLLPFIVYMTRKETVTDNPAQIARLISMILKKKYVEKARFVWNMERDGKTDQYQLYVIGHKNLGEEE